MGIGGHMLGERKLRRLNRETGMVFDRAYNRNGTGVARIKDETGCRHFFVSFQTWEFEEIPEPTHWWSCHHPDEAVAEAAKVWENYA
jgi:hypothetical protein